MSIASTLAGDDFSSEVSKNRIAPSHLGQKRVPLRCSSDSRQPPTRTPSATPLLSHLQPSEDCWLRGLSRSFLFRQSRNSSVHQGAGSIGPIGAALHTALRNQAFVYSYI